MAILTMCVCNSMMNDKGASIKITEVISKKCGKISEIDLCPGKILDTVIQNMKINGKI